MEYGFGVVFAWCEFGVEAYFFPSMKCLWMVKILGLFMVVCGDIMQRGKGGVIIPNAGRRTYSNSSVILRV